MATSEIGVVGDALRRKWLVAVTILVIGVLAGALAGQGGQATYVASATVRMQYPTNLATMPVADDFSAWLRTREVKTAAAQVAGVRAGEYGISAAVPPANKRLVEVKVTGPGRDKAEAYLTALIDAGRKRAQGAVTDQMSALTEAQQANKRALEVVDTVAKKADAMKAQADDPSVGSQVLTLVMQAASARASLLGDRAQTAATLSQLTRGVELQDGPNVAADTTGGGVVAGAIRGGVMALALVVIWLLVITRSERATVRESG